MNKKTVFISLAGLLGIIFIMFFSLKIFQIVYFNEKYYKVPNLKSYTVKEVTEALKNRLGKSFQIYLLERFSYKSQKQTLL